jgi:hypothetical protein
LLTLRPGWRLSPLIAAAALAAARLLATRLLTAASPSASCRRRIESHRREVGRHLIENRSR